MKINKREKRRRYLKLFKVFEEELKNYHSMFNDNNYSLSYIICRDYFGNDDEIKVIFNVYKGPSIKPLNFENYNLKILLFNFCKYFSIKDITITKSARTEIEGSKRVPVSNYSTKIQDRVFFEYFRVIDKYTEI